MYIHTPGLFCGCGYLTKLYWQVGRPVGLRDLVVSQQQISEIAAHTIRRHPVVFSVGAIDRFQELPIVLLYLSILFPLFNKLPKM